MDRVILIEYKERYDDVTDKIGIALNSNIAHKHIEELKRKFPYCYTNGQFYLSSFDVISK